jgi:hypothetical protein
MRQTSHDLLLNIGNQKLIMLCQAFCYKKFDHLITNNIGAYHAG